MRIPRILRVTVVVFTAWLALGASSAFAEGIGVGAKIGPLFSDVKFDGNDVSERKTGLMGGIFIGGNRPGTVGVMVEVNYGKTLTEISGTDFEQHFLDVPLFLRINAGSPDPSGLAGYFLIGPAFDVRLKSEIGDQDIKENTEDFGVNLNVAGGVEIYRIIAEFRYIRGLRNINKDFTQLSHFKSESFALLFGIRFN